MSGNPAGGTEQIIGAPEPFAGAELALSAAGIGFVEVAVFMAPTQAAA